MPIYRLEKTDGDLSKAELIVAQETDLQLEEHLESWLENSPGALIPDEIVLWIGRQTSARTEENVVFPDLLGVDADGNLIVAELKRAKTPRETVAQLLEYAAWANELTEEQLHAHAEEYFDSDQSFQDAFREAFDIPDDEEIPPLNRTMRLFIAAGEISPRVAAVCRFLRTAYGMDVSCLSVSAFQTEAGEILMSIETAVGDEPPAPSKPQKRAASVKTQKRAAPTSSLWDDKKKPVRETVRDAALELTGGDKEMEFTPKELFQVIIKTDPNFNRKTVNCQVAFGCPNHPSQKHESTKSEYYWRVRRGTFRLYDPDRDGADEAAFQTEADETQMSIEVDVENEDSTPVKTQQRAEPLSSRWSGDKPVKEVVREAAHEFTGGDTEMEFTPKELFEIIVKKYPEFNRATVLGQITPGCPNHPSQKHHSGKHKSYWRVGVGKYRLYDPERDGADESPS